MIGCLLFFFGLFVMAYGINVHDLVLTVIGLFMILISMKK